MTGKRWREAGTGLGPRPGHGPEAERSPDAAHGCGREGGTGRERGPDPEYGPHRGGEPGPAPERGRDSVRGLDRGHGPDRECDPVPDREGEREGPDRTVQRLARAALTRVLEPGDERAGRWLRLTGPVELMRRFTTEDGSAEELPGMTAARLGGYRLRAAAAEPGRDLAAVAAVGGRFVCPGDREWPSQLDDLGDARPVGLWVRGRPDLRLWSLRSVAVVGARACTAYGAHMAATLGSGLAERGWVVVSGAAAVLYPVIVVATAR